MVSEVYWQHLICGIEEAASTESATAAHKQEDERHQHLVGTQLGLYKVDYLHY